MAANDPLNVCITFDFDSICAWASGLQVETPTVLSRGEFAGRVGVPRLLDLLAEEEVKAAFFTPGHTIETFPEVSRRILAEGHEIGHHGYFHETPVTVTEDEERAILDRGIESMERCLDGYRPKGYRSPAWDLSQSSTKLLEEYGFLYDSSMMAMDFEPYWCRTGDAIHRDGPFEFGRELELVEIPVSWSLDDMPHLEFVMSPGMTIEAASAPKDLEAQWLADLEFAAEEIPGGVFTITFHPDCIARGARIRMVRSVIRRARELGANFATPAEVAEAWKVDAPAPAPARVPA